MAFFGDFLDKFLGKLATFSGKIAANQSTIKARFKQFLIYRKGSF